MIDTQPRPSKQTVLRLGRLPCEATVSSFCGADGVAEHNLVVRPTQCGDIETQASWLRDAYHDAVAGLDLSPDSGVFRRLFCSDPANQTEALSTLAPADAGLGSPCAVSVVGQPPVPPARVALWAYHVGVPGRRLAKTVNGGSLCVHRDGLTHVWTTGLSSSTAGSSYDQTKGIFGQYGATLARQGLSLADHVIRTWLYVQNVDADYQGVVDARREVFKEHGLTPQTHYIASTGIEGCSADAAARVVMDAYAIAGVRPEQIAYLSAPQYLCPTHVYGVTFERGVSVDYADRRHVWISGTASIDRAGAILHRGAVCRQLHRALQNVEALLLQAGAATDDVSVLLAYVRDPCDMEIVQRMLDERLPGVPKLVLLAAVCRPGWLVEVECAAIVPQARSTLPRF